MILSALLLAGMAGCTQQKSGNPGGKQSPPADPADAAKLDAAVLPEKPANAISVKDALTRNEGEKVVVTGRVPGGNLKPFNSAVAAVVLMAPEDLDREEIKSEFDCDDAAT
jgi:hypothetical protein